MTRRSLNLILRRVYALLVLVLLVSLVAKLARHIPGLAATPFETVLADVYEYMKDMALIFITVAAAYLANVFQKRAMFVDSLRHEWRSIVQTKSALFSFCEKSYPSNADYLEAFCRISESLDNMRIVYRNVGETDALIGLYPYAPLHDMRRALSVLDPRKNGNVTPEQRAIVRDAILQAFYALREKFLDELDLDEPTTPLTASVTRRLKRPGTTNRARRQQERQIKGYEGTPGPRPDIDQLLSDLYYREIASEQARGLRRQDEPQKPK